LRAVDEIEGVHAVDADQQHMLDAVAAKTAVSLGESRQTRRGRQQARSQNRASP
jgi:hypothetical protein